MANFPYKEIDWNDPKAVQELIGAMDRPVVFLFGAQLHITHRCPPGCIPVVDEREEPGKTDIECSCSSFG